MPGAEMYYFYFNQAMLGLIWITFFVYSQGLEKSAMIQGYNKTNLWIVSFLVTLYIGTRPISGVFVDMATYAQSYEITAATGESLFPDWLFNILAQQMSPHFSVETFFLCCAALYVFPMAWASVRVHGNWGLACLLCFITAFSFFTYGVNGIRNGIATSLVILGLSFMDKKLVALGLFALAAGFHKSALLPILAVIATALVNRPWLYAGIWTLCLLVAAIFQESVSSKVMALLTFVDDSRIESYAFGAGSDRGGFRLDFVLYSILPLIASYLTSEISIRSEAFYKRLISIYLITNSFWLLTMYAPFSNRFAYLSWFLMPWVIIYPFVPASKFSAAGNTFTRPNARLGLLGLALVAHHLFTYVMAVFVYPLTGG